MKKVLSTLCILVFIAAVTSCNSNPDVITLSAGSANAVRQADTANFTTVKWVDSVQNFGTVTWGDTAKIVYTFINTGNKPLWLTGVRPSCGCTLADYTKNAILPGQQGQVVALYASNHSAKDREDPVHKVINVTCNAKNATHTLLVFNGTVKPKA